MVRQCSRRTYRCALENFTSCGKFWENCKILEASCQTGRSPRFVFRVIFARPDPMVRKVAFFYNVAFCDLSYNKNTNLYMENFGSAAQLFPAFRSTKIRWLSFSGALVFPAFSSFFQISKIFQLMVQFFQPLQPLQLQLFQLLVSALTYCHRCGRTGKYGFAMESRATGKIWELWHLLEKLSNFGKRIVKF